MEHLLGRKKSCNSCKTKSGFSVPRKSRLVETTAVVNADKLARMKRGGALPEVKEFKERKPNKWLIHLKAYKAKHPNKSLKEAMIGAKSSYKPKKK